MLQRVLNAVAQGAVDCGNEFRAESAADRVASQRQRQACHLLPPPAEVDNAVQSGLVIGQLAFVDDQSSLVLALEHLWNDLVEGNNFSLHSGSKKLQREIGSGQRARNRDLFILDLKLRMDAAKRSSAHNPRPR